MSRHVVAGILGLALAGCAQDRFMASRSRSTLSAVEMTPPLATIHDTINQENAQVDPATIRDGRPGGSPDRPRAPQVAAADTAAGPSAPREAGEGNEPRTAQASAAPASGGRPAPFSGFRGTPRRRADEPQTTPPPATTEAEGTGAGLAATNPLPDPAPPAAPSEPVPSPVEPAPAPVPSPVEPAPVPVPAAEASPAPLTATPDRAPVDPPRAAEATPAPSPGQPSRAGRDPLLGANPDLMPSMDAMPAPKATQEPPSAAPAPAESSAAATAPAPAPAPEPAASALPEPAETAAVPPVVRLAPPTEIEPASAPLDGRAGPAATLPEPAPAPTGAPAGARDPLLGPNPEVMPNFDRLPARPQTPGPAAAAGRGGRPPSVSEIVGVAPTDIPAPSRTAPDPASPESPLDVPAAPAMPEPLPAPAPSPALAPRPTAGAAAPVPRPSKAPARDPLLGPQPDLMPAFEMPPAPASGQPALKPAKVVDPAPSPSPDAPASIAEPVELPPPSGPEASNSDRPRSSGGFASVPVTAPTEKTADPEVRRASGGQAVISAPVRPGTDPTAVRSATTPRALFQAGTPAAWVGESVITLHELTAAYKQRRKMMPAGQEISEDTKRAIVRSILNEMVERELVIQEARRDLKDAKRFQKFMEMADGVFFEKEVPPLLRQTASANVTELKQKLSDRGESLDEMREQFRLEFLSQGYMEQKLGPRMSVDLLEMREYYRTHMHDFDQPAQVTWRELLVEVDRSKSRDEARKKADALLARLRRGDDFAAIARSESDGPNKADGGLWKTSPGSYGVPAVNSALDTLPIGRVSQVIEGPTSYHIVVVEERRQAGPATFAEVQDKVKLAIRRGKISRETTAYIDKLRKRTVIRTVFDDPGVTRTSAETVTPAR